jgi:hypothetical protein
MRLVQPIILSDGQVELDNNCGKYGYDDHSVRARGHSVPEAVSG